MGQIFIGTSGYQYEHWRGVFYPQDLPQSQWLKFYAKHLNSVELNVTFYRLPKKEIFQRWAKETPNNFNFVLKGSRLITHFQQLKDSEEALKEFFETSNPLGKKLKAVLWQLPPKFASSLSLEAKLERFEEFCEALKKESRPGIFQAFELRDRNLWQEKVFAVLKEHQFIMVWDDYRGWDKIPPPTSQAIYIRRHGPTGFYGGSYSKKELVSLNQIIKKHLVKNGDCFVFFNNDAEGFAVKNALELKFLLKDIPRTT